MRYWKIAILLMLLASSAACTVEKHSGLEIGGSLSCMQEDTPKEGATISSQSEGSFDLLVSWYYGYHYASYSILLYFTNTLTSSANTEFMQGEGNVYDVKQLEVEYVVPEGWDEIDGISIPFSWTALPGATNMARFDIIPSNVRDAIDANYAKNAYQELQPYSLLRPSVTDGSGNPISCTPATADKKCNGYKCITDDASKINDKTATGVCANTCTSSSGCAQVCGADGVPCISSFNRCDIGASDFGICRESCRANEQCTPLKDPASGDVLIEYACMNEMCIPDAKLVNPHVPQPIIVKMKLSGENSDGGSITSNTYSFPLTVGRGNLLQMSNAYNCCCQKEGCQSYLFGGEQATDACKWDALRQDLQINCANVNGCKDFFCKQYDVATCAVDEVTE